MMTPACSVETKAPAMYLSKTWKNAVSGARSGGPPVCSSSAPLHTPRSIARMT